MTDFLLNDTQLKLLKDLKACVAVKSTVGDDSVPAAITKLKERITLIRNRPISDLRAYLTCKGCDRDDVLDSLCS